VSIVPKKTTVYECLLCKARFESADEMYRHFQTAHARR